MHLAFLGFGLIGGSIARAVRASDPAPAWTMRAWSPSGDGPAAALADGVIDGVASTPQDVLFDADLVILAAPPTTCLAVLDDLAGPWRAALPPTAVITDVASTKAALVSRADGLGLRFVGGHPMAGLEAAGYAAARADLFVDRPWVITPGARARAADVERVTELVAACRARAVLLDPAVHDRAVAGISHLPLLLSAALVESVAGRRSEQPGDDWALAGSLAAGGWRDMSRLARGDPAMGAGIAATNAEALLARLDDLLVALEGWRSLLADSEAPDEGAIRARLESARRRLEERT
jgi:prephenate dehydrogenase